MEMRLLVLFMTLMLMYGIGAKNIPYPKDCHEVRLAGHTKSGVYKIYLNATMAVKVMCEHRVNKSYTVIQQRRPGYGINNFFRGYNDYQIGFGVVSGDFWIGLITIHHLTSQGNTVLDLQLQDWSGLKRRATYKYFAIGDAADRYRLQVAKFSGTVIDDLSYSNNMQFATYDAPDYYKCAANQRAGWWYNYCAYALLNGRYYTGGAYTPVGGFYDGIYWKDWRGFGYSLKYARMLVSRP